MREVYAARDDISRAATPKITMRRSIRLEHADVQEQITSSHARPHHRQDYAVIVAVARSRPRH